MVLLSGLFFSCKKDCPAPGQPRMVFWAACGECYPMTAKFTLTDSQLFAKDNLVLGDSLFQAARVLIEEKPGLLCSSDRDAYGCGACYDGVSYYVQSDCDGQTRTWQFDPNDHSWPAEINVYADLVEAVYNKCAQ